MSSAPPADADEPPPLAAQNVPPHRQSQTQDQNDNPLRSAKAPRPATTTTPTTGTSSAASFLSASTSASAMPFCSTPELCAPRPPKRPRPAEHPAPATDRADAVPLPKRFAPALAPTPASRAAPLAAPASSSAPQPPIRPHAPVSVPVPVPMTAPLPLPLAPRQPGPKRPPPVGSQRFTAAGKPMPLIDTSAPHSTLFVPPDTSGLTKREARLVKNRAAAFLSRQRRREQLDLLDGRCRALGRLVWVLLTVLSTMAGDRPGSSVLAALACEDADVLAVLQQVVDQQGVLTTTEDDPPAGQAGSSGSASASANGGGSGSSSDTSSISPSTAAPSVRPKSAHEILAPLFGHPPAPPADEAGKSLRAEIKRLKSLLVQQQEQPGSPTTTAVLLPPPLPAPVPNPVGMPWGVPFFPLGTPFAPPPMYPLSHEADPAPFKTCGKGLNLTLAPEADVEEERGKGKAPLRLPNRDSDRDRERDMAQQSAAHPRERDEEPSDFTTLGMEWEDPLLSVVLGEAGLLPLHGLDGSTSAAGEGPSSRGPSPPPLTLPQLLEKEEDHPTPSSLDSHGRSTAATSTSNHPAPTAPSAEEQTGEGGEHDHKECICPASVRAQRSIRRARAHVATLVVALAFAYVASHLPPPRAYEAQRAEDRAAG